MVYCYRKISKSDEQPQDSGWVPTTLRPRQRAFVGQIRLNPAVREISGRAKDIVSVTQQSGQLLKDASGKFSAATEREKGVAQADLQSVCKLPCNTNPYFHSDCLSWVIWSPADCCLFFSLNNFFFFFLFFGFLHSVQDSGSTRNWLFPSPCQHETKTPGALVTSAPSGLSPLGHLIWTDSLLKRQFIAAAEQSQITRGTRSWSTLTRRSWQLAPDFIARPCADAPGTYAFAGVVIGL